MSIPLDSIDNVNMNFEKVFIEDKYKWLRHLTFWLLIYLDEVVDFFYYWGEGVFNNFLIPLGLDMGLVYFNIYFLLPKLLFRKQYFLYLIATVLSLACIVWINFYLILIDVPIEELDIFYTIFDTTFMTAGVLSLAIAIKLTKYFLERQQKINDLRQSQLASEINYLKEQTNPHFLFNTLNSIYVMAKQKKESTPDAIMQLSDLMRYQTYDASKEKVTLDNEIEFITNYLALEKIRRDKLITDIKIIGDRRFEKIEPLIFLPFVENAVKHSMSTDGREEHIKIIVSIDNENITLEVRNSKGFNRLLQLDENHGFGLENVRKRLHLLYPDNHELHIIENEDEYIITLNIHK